MEKINIFPFQWNFEDEWKNYKLKSVIRIWGWNEANEGVCIRVEDFLIPMWVELPMILNGNAITWTDDIITKVATTLSEHKDIKPSLKPAQIDLEYRQRLYDNQFFKDDDGTYKSKTFPFLRVEFHSQRALQSFNMLLNNPIEVLGLGKIKLTGHCTSKNLTPVMKLMAIRNLPSSNWILARGMLPIKRESNKKYEYVVSYKNLMTNPKSEQLPIVYPVVCSFDIETYSSDHNRFPDPENPNDKIIQIGCVFAQKGNVKHKVCLCLGTPEKHEDTLGDGDDNFEIIEYKSEADLLMGWTETIKKHNPDVLIGYNIFGFDIKFMVARANMLRIWDDFSKFGSIADKNADFLNIKWESSARGVVDLYFLNAHGRLFVDLLPIIRASENLKSYTLEAVASHYLTVNKDPIKAKDIFKSWANKDWKMVYSVAKYCVQDTYVTFLLFEKLLIWLGLTESATTNKVPIFCMVSQGQQIKAFAQVFDFCFNNNTVCNPPAKKPKAPYKGAIVTEPIAGLYKMILPFDFASLYPSIMIAHNIDFSRFVPTDTSIPDEHCYCFNWEDHSGCIHDPETKPTKQRFTADGIPIVAKPKKVICNSYSYRFLKQQYGGAGVVPTIITNLLAARKKVRKVIEANEQRIHELEESTIIPKDEKKNEINKLKEINAVLDKRQLAYKVNANSMYGMYGAETGYLPFFPGAETVTYVGRTSILKASRRIEEVHKGKVIYNDTDSAYCYFDHMKDKSVKEIWDFAEGVVKDIESLFVKPMKLEFEGKIYVKFMIFTKKKYVAQPIDEHGKLKEKLYMRGVPLVRREYCANMKYIYEKCVRFILNNIDELTAIPKAELKNTQLFKKYLTMIHDNFLNALRWQVPLNDFVIYKGLTKEHYATPQAHAAVAEKMRARGTPVAVNSRIEYVLLAESDGIYNKDKRQYEITEDLGYFKEFREVLRLDYLQYFTSQYVNYFEQMTSTIFGVDKEIKRMVLGASAQENNQRYALRSMHDIQTTQVAPKKGKLTLKEKLKKLGFGGSFLDKNKLLSQLHSRFAPTFTVNESMTTLKVIETKQNELLQPANGMFNYYTYHRGKRLNDWVKVIDSNLRMGTYEYDSLISILGNLFLKSNCKDTDAAKENGCIAMHEGWSINYNYWNQHKPHLTDKRYTINTSIGDERQNLKAFVKYPSLTEDDKKYYQTLYTTVLKQL